MRRRRRGCRAVGDRRIPRSRREASVPRGRRRHSRRGQDGPQVGTERLRGIQDLRRMRGGVMTRTGSVEDATIRVQVVLGERDLSLRDLSSVAKGSIIELASIAGEPVDLVAAGVVIAKGEVVVIDENFGIRVTELVGRGDAP
ncbi:MAG: FliM/FliN family flagellar motor switch protein [Spirochaetes bacterium]|nr:FliM/FliN family flagellar motor switch protein [Spirochaetota bacterium]MBU1079175.1 FliM/FliN family flagellar motor switch protein [Spirochaetota bacterium]